MFDPTLAAEVALFGLGNIGLALYKFGRVDARLDSLEKGQDEGCAPLANVRERVGRIEGRLDYRERDE